MLDHEETQNFFDLNNDLSDLIFFVIIFIILAILMAPGFVPTFRTPYQCTQNNGNFKACVQAQNEGKGCAWFSDCNVCGRSGESVKKVCKQ